jgi:DNA-binding protein YbaB
MDNDAARHDFANVLALVQEQMRDLSTMQRKRVALSAKAAAADGTVEVTVDARCMVTEIVIDETYLEEFELAELGGHIVGAARAAGQEVGRQAVALGAPLSERRKAISALSGMVDVPEFAEVISNLNPPASVVPDELRPNDSGDEEGWEDGPSFPTVRR